MRRAGGQHACMLIHLPSEIFRHAANAADEYTSGAKCTSHRVAGMERIQRGQECRRRVHERSEVYESLRGEVVERIRLGQEALHACMHKLKDLLLFRHAANAADEYTSGAKCTSHRVADVAKDFGGN